ncbi:MFS transporter [Novosphingobium sp. AP12]|uniref:MFS transporter n=1 Tax=Novosphingobium sp. AP12 TaxID=1144305 RepID=UPI0002720534|nr:MFS transporter [Novosphingobium sp. AP12]EJL33971.1 Na+/melibiose symporter-like transporter [Novosphingobium sp. AP12]
MTSNTSGAGAVPLGIDAPQDLAAPAGSKTWRIRFGSLLIPLAHAAGQNVVTVLGLRFMTDSLAISAGAAGLIFALVKIYDGFLDPAIGAWSDRAATPWGRRLPFLFAGGIAMPLGIALLFGAPDFGSILLAQVFVTLALAIHASGYTLLTIPGFAMVVESSSDPHERTRLMAWRTYGNAIGTLIGSTLPAWLLGMTGPTRGGHLLLAVIVGVVVFLTTMLAVRLLRDAPRTQPRIAAVAARRNPLSALGYQVKLAWNNRPFRILAIAHVFLLFGTAIGSAALAYFTRSVLGLGDEVLGTYFMMATVTMVLGMTVWVWLSGRIGKKVCYMAALALFGLVQLSWLLASPGESMALVSLRGLASGFAGGGMILCAYALLSDAVRYDYVQSGERREGAFAGFTTLFDKLSSAAALAAMGVFLGAMGYAPSGSGMAAQQGGRAIMAIMLCESAVPAVAMLGAIVALCFYKLDPAQLEALENSQDTKA